MGNTYIIVFYSISYFSFQSNSLGCSMKKSAKSHLFEICAANHWKPPKFICCKETGASHLKEWVSNFFPIFLCEYYDYQDLVRCFQCSGFIIFNEKIEPCVASCKVFFVWEILEVFLLEREHWSPKTILHVSPFELPEKPALKTLPFVASIAKSA